MTSLFPAPLRCRLPVALLLLAAPAALRAETAFDCVMDAARIIELSARTPGVIESVAVEKGQPVAQGDVIAMIDSTMEQAALNILEARAASTAAIDAQTARVAFVQAQLARAETLERQNAQSQVKVEELRYELELASTQLRQAQADLAALQAEAARARIAVENTRIRAPVAGVVTEVSLSAGEYATADRHVAILAQTDPIHVDAYLPAELYDRVRPGTPVRIHTEHPVGKVIAAQVLSVDALFDPASRTFGLRVSLPNPDKSIVAGQRCRIELVTP